MHRTFVFAVALLSALDFASALKFPLMGDQIITPRRPQAVSVDNESITQARLARRQQAWQRRLEARAHLEERFRLFGWLDAFDGSSNGYVRGWPTFGKTCASTATPYIRSSVCSPLTTLTVDNRYQQPRKNLHRISQEQRPQRFSEMAEEHGHSRHAISVSEQHANRRHCNQRRRTSRHVEWRWCL
jgi:hypothetical protein